MFCPNEIAFGDVAGWVAGLGALAAVIAALYIAGSERRAAERRRAEDRDSEKARQTLIIEEAMRVANEARNKAAAYALLVKMGGGGGIARRQELVEELGGFRRQLEALQAFPMTDPRLFAEIGRAAHECRVEVDLPEKSTSYGEQIMNLIAARMSQRIETLETLKNTGQAASPVMAQPSYSSTDASEQKCT